MSLHTPAGLVSGLKWAQAPHWFCVALEASTPCQFLSIHSTLSSVSLIGSPPISKIPQPRRNWLPFSHSANAIVQVHSVSLWMRWSLTHEFWDKRPMGCLSTSLLNRSYISASNNYNALKKSISLQGNALLSSLVKGNLFALCSSSTWCRTPCQQLCQYCLMCLSSSCVMFT